MRIPVSLKVVLPLFFLMAFFAFDARADIDSSGLLDNVLDRYSAAVSSWAGVITSAATWLFWTLVVISMVWTFGMMAFRKADLSEFFAEFVRFTVFVGFFWWLLMNGPNFADSIIRSLRILGGNATGLGGDLRPSRVVDVGFAIFYMVLERSSVWVPVDSAVGIIMAMIILIILALIGVNMLLLLISAWVLMYAGVFFLGFGGSRWTSDIAIGYYKTVLSIAAQLLVMVLLVGIGQTFLEDYYSAMNAGIRLHEMGVMLIVAVVLFALVNKIPPLIGQLPFGGGTGGNIGAFGAGATLGIMGATMSAGAMAGAMALSGAYIIAGGAQSIMSAFKKAGNNVSAGTDFLSQYSSGGGNSFSEAGGSSGGGSFSSGNSTPYGDAAGFGTKRSGYLSTAGRIAADATANIARGTMQVAKTKANNIKEGVAERIAGTTGGKIAATIREVSRAASNNLSWEDNEVDPKEEVATFVNRKHGNNNT
jgi:type IV secretion system protein TrbL